MIVQVDCNTLAWCAQTSSLQQQEHAAAKLQAQIIKDPGNPNLHLELATTLHGLDQLHPDGGRRIPEAERAYKWVWCHQVMQLPIWLSEGMTHELVTACIQGSN
jgi:hypothetical protein